MTYDPPTPERAINNTIISLKPSPITQTHGKKEEKIKTVEDGKGKKKKASALLL